MKTVLMLNLKTKVLCERCNENWLDEKVMEQTEIEKRKAVGV